MTIKASLVWAHSPLSWRSHLPEEATLSPTSTTTCMSSALALSESSACRSLCFSIWVTMAVFRHCLRWSTSTVAKPFAVAAAMLPASPECCWACNCRSKWYWKENCTNSIIVRSRLCSTAKFSGDDPAVDCSTFAIITGSKAHLLQTA